MKSIIYHFTTSIKSGLRALVQISRAFDFCEQLYTGGDTQILCDLWAFIKRSFQESTSNGASNTGRGDYVEGSRKILPDIDNPWNNDLAVSSFRPEL